MLQIETATVYRAAGRRFFTKDAAIHALAKQKYKQKHPCECSGVDEDYCGLHPGEPNADKAIRRLTKIYKKAARKVKQ